jgi:hypothetical protein
MPLQLLAPVATATALLTLKSDTAPAKIYVRRPRGTLYWGGAGLDGPYVQPQLDAFRAGGLTQVSVGITNTASTLAGPRLGTLLDAIRAGLVIRYEDMGDWVITSGMAAASPQFNLIGYSYGSLLAAQTANFYARRGHIVDHLVLIASPIDADFLARLRAAPHIKKVVVIDLTAHGDPIHAGISQTELVAALPTLKAQQDKGMGEGHFYYAHLGRDSRARWAGLAQRLMAEGLR